MRRKAFSSSVGAGDGGHWQSCSGLALSLEHGFDVAYATTMMVLLDGEFFL